MLISTIAVLLLSRPGTLPLLIIGNGINSWMFGIVWPSPWTVAGSMSGPYAFRLSLGFLDTYGVISILTALSAAGILIFSPFASRPEAP
ncbi:hypothetical protein CSA56_18105 [candidate division KSB3 bacterium]|uniref:Uncharacterized protein n=1 Tax=candidate division KSB3 bacterium TaxID=2044937 RepID=A0A2G6K734_9BACT|nr:MAG: hypothetical protein CSA56_18105 [candidate division KSB3 bacterium]